MPKVIKSKKQKNKNKKTPLEEKKRPNGENSPNLVSLLASHFEGLSCV
jgi:hypothetical protein